MHERIYKDDKANAPVSGDRDSDSGMHRLGDRMARQRRRESRTAQARDIRAALEAGTAGAPAPIPHREQMERAFGRSFAGVEAYTGATDICRALRANAFTFGQRMVFAADSPSPQTTAHELAHTLQGTESEASPTGVGEADGAAEREAEVMAAEAIAGAVQTEATPLVAPTLQREPVDDGPSGGNTLEASGEHSETPASDGDATEQSVNESDAPKDVKKGKVTLQISIAKRGQFEGSLSLTIDAPEGGSPSEDMSQVKGPQFEKAIELNKEGIGLKIAGSVGEIEVGGPVAGISGLTAKLVAKGPEVGLEAGTGGVGGSLHLAAVSIEVEGDITRWVEEQFGLHGLSAAMKVTVKGSLTYQLSADDAARMIQTRLAAKKLERLLAEANELTRQMEESQSNARKGKKMRQRALNRQRKTGRKKTAAFKQEMAEKLDQIKRDKEAAKQAGRKLSKLQKEIDKAGRAMKRSTKGLRKGIAKLMGRTLGKKLATKLAGLALRAIPFVNIGLLVFDLVEIGMLIHDLSQGTVQGPGGHGGSSGSSTTTGGESGEDETSSSSSTGTGGPSEEEDGDRLEEIQQAIARLGPADRQVYEVLQHAEGARFEVEHIEALAEIVPDDLTIAEIESLRQGKRGGATDPDAVLSSLVRFVRTVRGDEVGRGPAGVFERTGDEGDDDERRSGQQSDALEPGLEIEIDVEILPHEGGEQARLPADRALPLLNASTLSDLAEYDPEAETPRIAKDAVGRLLDIGGHVTVKVEAVDIKEHKTVPEVKAPTDVMFIVTLEVEVVVIKSSSPDWPVGQRRTETVEIWVDRKGGRGFFTDASEGFRPYLKVIANGVVELPLNPVTVDGVKWRLQNARLVEDTIAFEGVVMSEVDSSKGVVTGDTWEKYRRGGVYGFSLKRK